MSKANPDSYVHIKTVGKILKYLKDCREDRNEYQALNGVLNKLLHEQLVEIEDLIKENARFYVDSQNWKEKFEEAAKTHGELKKKYDEIKFRMDGLEK